MLRKLLLPLLLAATIVMGSPEMSSAAFDAKLDIFLSGAFSGADERLGEEVFMYDVSGVLDGVFLDIYGIDAKPITLNPEFIRLPMRLDVGYTMDRTRLDMSWLKLQSETDGSGTASGYYADPIALFYGFITFWDMGRDLYESRGPFGWYEQVGPPESYTEMWDPDKGASTWRASQDINLDSAYLTFEHAVVESKAFRLGVIGGFHKLNWQEQLDQDYTDIAHYRFVDPEDIADWVGEESVDNPDVYIYHNEITIETESTTKYNPQGLALGASADWQITDQLGLKGSVVGSYLTGKSKFHGRGSDTDNITETYQWNDLSLDGPMETTSLSLPWLLYGEMNLPENQRSLSTSSVQAEVSIDYDINDTLFANAGFYYSLWKDLPMAPRWHYPDETTGISSNEQWTTDSTSDVSFSGWRLGIGARF